MDFTKGGISPANIAADSDRNPHKLVDPEISAELHEGERVEVSSVVARNIDDVYRFWRDFSNHPKFMSRISRVEIVSPTRSRWHWKTIGGIELTWESEIIEDLPGRVIAWQTTASSHVHHAGSIRFKDLGEGRSTEVYLRVMYRIPGGRLAETLAQLLREAPAQVLSEDMARFHALLESDQDSLV